MNLVYLQVGKPKHKTHFVQHIHRLHHVKLEKGDTLNTLFDKVKDSFKDEPEALAAAESWVDFNKEGTDPKEFEQEVTQQDDMYAIFDLKP